MSEFHVRVLAFYAGCTRVLQRFHGGFICGYNLLYCSVAGIGTCWKYFLQGVIMVT